MMALAWYEWAIAVGASILGVFIGIASLAPVKHNPTVTLVPDPEPDEDLEEERYLRVVK